jgi:uncharacterized protein
VSAVALILVVLLAFATDAVGQPSSRLVHAAKARDWNAVRAMSKAGDVNAADPDGATALHWAAHWDDVAAVELLLARGARAEAASALRITPLMLACMNGNAPIAQRLLQAGANPNAASAGGETALMMAARTGNTAIVRALVAAGANVSATEPRRGQTAIMWAAAEGHDGALRALVEGGADVNSRSCLGFTPLMFVARSGNAESACALLAVGAPRAS